MYDWQKSLPKLPPEGHENVWHEVIWDMIGREKLGFERYNRPVTPYNGRRALQDAYEEVLDLAVYLKQKLVEDLIRESESSIIKLEVTNEKETS